MASQEMYLFVADISGYTSFLIQNKKEYMHGMLVITELLRSLAKEVSLPLAIAKLEGDAIFMFVPADHITSGFSQADLRVKILGFYNCFSKRLYELQHSMVCSCGACINIDKLQLKIIAHYGTVEMNSIGAFQELASLDVVLLHRLLKNSVKERCYFLMTEPAYQRLAMPSGEKVSLCVEKDKDLGDIPVYLYIPVAHPREEKKFSWFSKAKEVVKLIFDNFLLRLKLKKLHGFRNPPFV